MNSGDLLVDWYWIVALVAGFLLLLAVVWRLILGNLRRLAQTTCDDVKAELGEGNILLVEPAANCFGEKSRGPTQGRGNGCWALTREKIHFEYWVGRRIIEIPLHTVVGTRIAMGFLGKSRGIPLLVVTHRNDSGEDNECAWMFKDIETVQSRLEGLVAEARA
jgi:hypothetical protein